MLVRENTRSPTACGDDKPATPRPAQPTVDGGGGAAQPTEQADVVRGGAQGSAEALVPSKEAKPTPNPNI